MPDYQKLLTLIQIESDLGSQLQDCLIDERQQLETRDLSGLQEILVKKAGLLTEIEAAREARNEYLGRIGFESNPSELLKQLRKHADTTTIACIDALEECQNVFNKSKEYNELNGLLIVNSRKRNLHKLDIMKGIHEEQKIYDAQGQTAPAGSQQTRKLA